MTEEHQEHLHADQSEEDVPAEVTSEADGPAQDAAEQNDPVQEDSEEMSLETLETHIQEAEELHRSLSRRLDETSRD